MTNLTTRVATVADAAAIVRIHNHGIAERIATFQTTFRTAEQVAEQVAHQGEHVPTIVVERGREVVAWASIGPYRAHDWYAGIGEHSVYVDPRHRGVGAGRVALDALCVACAERGYWKLVSRVFPENVASLALHERAGFRVVGVYRRHGRLDGEWRDCVIIEKLLGIAGEDQ